MSTDAKKRKIKKLVRDMLKVSHDSMIQKIDNVLNSGAIDVDSWDGLNAPMILPKCIVTALLQTESHQYEGKGTSFEKQIKKETANIRCFV